MTGPGLVCLQAAASAQRGYTSAGTHNHSCQRETCCRRPQSIRKMIVVLWTDVKAQPKAANISQELMEEELWCAAD